MNEKDTLPCEFEYTSNVRFLDYSNVTAYDSDGNELMCTCGKPATSSIIGKDSFANMCSDCLHIMSKK